MQKVEAESAELLIIGIIGWGLTYSQILYLKSPSNIDEYLSLYWSFPTL